MWDCNNQFFNPPFPPQASPRASAALGPRSSSRPRWPRPRRAPPPGPAMADPGPGGLDCARAKIGVWRKNMEKYGKIWKNVHEPPYISSYFMIFHGKTTENWAGEWRNTGKLRGKKTETTKKFKKSWYRMEIENIYLRNHMENDEKYEMNQNRPRFCRWNGNVPKLIWNMAPPPLIWLFIKMIYAIFTQSLTFLTQRGLFNPCNCCNYHLVI